jgi:hypothetical protein
MRSGAELDRLAEAAAARYQGLLTGFEAILARSLGGRDWRSSRARTALRREAYEAASVWLETERSLILDALDETAEAAVRAVEDAVGTKVEPLSDVILDHIAGLARELEHSLCLQIERDSMALTAALRDATLRSVLRGRGARPRMGRTPVTLRDDTLSSVVFAYSDRTGRRWASTKYVRTVWRQALVHAGAEAVLLRISEIGLDLAVVTHPDAAHEGSGRRVALVDGAKGEPWGVLREEVFHPNTYARLAPVLEAV